MASIVACSTAKKIALGNGGIIKLPPDARELNKNELVAENQKYLESPLQAFDYTYITDNVLITFHKVRNIKPDVDNFEKAKIGLESMFNDNPIPGGKTQVSIVNADNNQALILCIKRKSQSSITLNYKNNTSNLAFNCVIRVN